MGRFTTVRGWIELNDEMVAEVKGIIDLFRHKHRDYDITEETADLYQSGWVIQSKIINWSRHIFYGADIQSRSLNFIKDQVKEIATKVRVEDPPATDRPRGHFTINDEEESYAHIWFFQDGIFEEEQREGIFSS